MLLAREDGAAMIFVALAMSVILGSVVLVVDTGIVWVARRALTAAAESSALAAANAYALGADGCAEAQLAVLAQANSPGASLECIAGAGDWVTVRATSAPVATAFGAILHGSPQVRAAASARWRPLRTVSGARPVAICAGDPRIGTPGVHRFAYGPGCGSGWIVLDPDGAPQPGSDLTGWLRRGYPAEIGMDGCVPGPCERDDAPGRGALDSGLGALVSAGDPVVLPVVDPSLRIAGLAGAIVRAFSVEGARDAWTIDLEFVPVVAQGASGLAPDAGVRSISLCGVDTDPAGESARC